MAKTLLLTALMLAGLIIVLVLIVGQPGLPSEPGASPPPAAVVGEQLPELQALAVRRHPDGSAGQYVYKLVDDGVVCYMYGNSEMECLTIQP